ncbi:MAG: hypothetical protein ACOC56_01950 [Atribacterota bacterium]
MKKQLEVTPIYLINEKVLVHVHELQENTFMECTTKDVLKTILENTGQRITIDVKMNMNNTKILKIRKVV